MATNNVINGTDIGIYISTTSGGTYTLVAFSTDASLSLAMETRDITNKDSSGWRELLESTRSGSISGNFLYAQNDSAGADVFGFVDLYGYYTGRTPLFVKFQTSGSGDSYYTASCYLTSLEASAPTEDNTTCSLTLELSGAITTATN